MRTVRLLWNLLPLIKVWHLAHKFIVILLISIISSVNNINTVISNIIRIILSIIISKLLY